MEAFGKRTDADKNKTDNDEKEIKKTCKFNNKGYCRVKESCKFFHNDEVCEYDGKCFRGESSA